MHKNEAGKLALDLFFVFKKIYMKQKQVANTVPFYMFRWNSTWAYNKKQAVQHFRLLIQRYAQFWFLEKGLRLAFPRHFVYDFSKKNISHVVFY